MQTVYLGNIVMCEHYHRIILITTESTAINRDKCVHSAVSSPAIRTNCAKTILRCRQLNQPIDCLTVICLSVCLFVGQRFFPRTLTPRLLRLFKYMRPATSTDRQTDRQTDRETDRQTRVNGGPLSAPNCTDAGGCDKSAEVPLVSSLL